MCKTGRKQGCIFQDFQHSIGYPLFPLPPVNVWQISSSWEDSRSWYCNCNIKPHDNLHLTWFHVQTALSRQSSTKNHLTSSDVWFYGCKSNLESVLHTFTLFQMFSNGRFLLLWQENLKKKNFISDEQYESMYLQKYSVLSYLRLVWAIYLNGCITDM